MCVLLVFWKSASQQKIPLALSWFVTLSQGETDPHSGCVTGGAADENTLQAGIQIGFFSLLTVKLEIQFRLSAEVLDIWSRYVIAASNDDIFRFILEWGVLFWNEDLLIMENQKSAPGAQW